ncbi:hypothetical protein [Natronomonas sp. LN261]|jgi:hypothetical protein|uniref:hypothetical protein n=1 Tax=Natronomonas sp. LN261 TaxID=2750669 RepID=UPI0015EF71E7|nr:hypothetical protein [Natronomonas sp. LN261]
MCSEDGHAHDVVDWTVLKSIQKANAESMGAMEQYLLIASYPDAVGSADRTRELLERSIEHHERVIEQLELAATEIDAEITRETS